MRGAEASLQQYASYDSVDDKPQDSGDPLDALIQKMKAKGQLEETEQDEDYFKEDPGHPAVVKANDALYEAYAALDELADIIEKQGTEAMVHAEPSLGDVHSKIEMIGRYPLQWLGKG